MNIKALAQAAIATIFFMQSGLSVVHAAEYKSTIKKKVWSCDNPHFGNVCSYHYVLVDGVERSITQGISVAFYADLNDGINANVLAKMTDEGYAPCIAFDIGGSLGRSLIVQDLLPADACE